METSHKVSIGMPLYNAERYLRESLDCLLSQTFGDFELVISDNGSTDATEAICVDYAKRDGRIKYHRENENRGAIWNFNRVFELSRGEYFKFAAYDDLLHETFLQRCVGCLDDDPDVVWCHSLTNHIDATGNVISATNDPSILGDEKAHSLLFAGFGMPEQTRASATPHQRFSGVLLGTTWCADSYGLIRAAALKRTHLLRPCYGSEKVLVGELSLQGRYAEIPETLFFARIHGEASGALLSAAAQRTFVAGATRHRFSSTRWDLLKGHLGAIRHAPLTYTEKLRCVSSLMRYVLQLQKWKRIIAQAATGIGVGAEARSEQDFSECARVSGTNG